MLGKGFRRHVPSDTETLLVASIHVVFYSFADGPEGGIYYDVHAIEQMRYKLTMLAYDMNGTPLPSPSSAAATAGTTRITSFSGTDNPSDK